MSQFNIDANDTLKTISAKQKDVLRKFVTVFDNDIAREVLDYLDKYSHMNFPNYENVNATFSKIGEQTLVAYIRAMTAKAKLGGE